MTGHRTEPLQTVTTVRNAAETLGFNVTENPGRSNGHLTLDITRSSQYEFVASFRRKATGYWAWEFGYDYREDPTLRVHTMTRFIERLRSTNKEG
jgi:hypothetical protein